MPPNIVSMVRRKDRPLELWQEVIAALLDVFPAPLSAGQIQRKTGIDGNGVARAAAVAEELGLIRRSKEGPAVMHSLTPRGRLAAEHVKKLKEVVEGSGFKRG